MAITSARLTPTCSRMRRIIFASIALSPRGLMLRSHSPYMPNTDTTRGGMLVDRRTASGSAARIR
ncbi:hypothetical protein D3C80_2135450 [compost metagenome]